MKGIARLTLAAALASLAGCSLFERPAEPAPAAAAEPAPLLAPLLGRSTAQELMAYMGRLRAMNETSLAAETTRQRQAAQKQPTDVAKLKVAMAMVIAPQAEETDILAVVDPIARKESAEAEVRAMASFLQGIAVERRRLKESAATAGARLRDERKARETEKQRAEAMQERAAQLQQKLDALTDLEKSLSDRPNPTR
jgi:selenocysteine-specific translation elongation factor